MSWLRSRVLWTDSPIVIETLTLFLIVSLVLAYDVTSALDVFAKVLVRGVVDGLRAAILTHQVLLL